MLRVSRKNIIAHKNRPKRRLAFSLESVQTSGDSGAREMRVSDSEWSHVPTATRCTESIHTTALCGEGETGVKEMSTDAERHLIRYWDRGSQPIAPEAGGPARAPGTHLRPGPAPSPRHQPPHRHRHIRSPLALPGRPCVHCLVSRAARVATAAVLVLPGSRRRSSRLQ